MSAWDADHLSRRFEHLAQNKDLRVEECRRRSGRSPGHKRAHDEALAEFYVYNRLHGRTFLSSAGALVKELRAMKGLDFKAGSSAFEPDDFERFRIQTIDELLREFEPLVNDR